MTGWAGDIGSRKMAEDAPELMRRRFSPPFLRRFDSLGAEGNSHDGVYQQLWRLGESLGCGIEVRHELIPIRQETIEICELTEADPYMLETTCEVFVLGDDEEREDCRIIGRTTNGNDRVVLMRDGRRYLTRA